MRAAAEGTVSISSPSPRKRSRAHRLQRRRESACVGRAGKTTEDSLSPPGPRSRRGERPGSSTARAAVAAARQRGGVLVELDPRQVEEHLTLVRGTRNDDAGVIRLRWVELHPVKLYNLRDGCAGQDQ